MPSENKAIFLCVLASRRTIQPVLKGSEVFAPERHKDSRFTSHRQNPRSDQMGQPHALLGGQHRVDLFQRADHRHPDALVAFGAALAGGRGFGGVELLAGQGVGEFRQRAAFIDGGLGTLGLELIENACQLDDLLFVQLQSLSKKPKCEITSCDPVTLSRDSLGVSSIWPSAGAADRKCCHLYHLNEHACNSVSFPMDATTAIIGDHDRQLLLIHYAFYHALESGQRVPVTPAQQHFVDVCRGAASPETDHERAYLRLKHAALAGGVAEADLAATGFILPSDARHDDGSNFVDIPVRQCTGCGRPIAPERLEVMPDATRCISCQRHSESAPSRVSQMECPDCASHGIKSPMVWRTARDPNEFTGYFLGCSRFPVCRYIDRS